MAISWGEYPYTKITKITKIGKSNNFEILEIFKKAFKTAKRSISNELKYKNNFSALLVIDFAYFWSGILKMCLKTGKSWTNVAEGLILY